VHCHSKQLSDFWIPPYPKRILIGPPYDRLGLPLRWRQRTNWVNHAQARIAYIEKFVSKLLKQIFPSSIRNPADFPFPDQLLQPRIS